MKFYYLKPYLVNDSAPQQGVRISNTKGFGFITPENGDKDVFVHASQLDNVGGTLQEGQAVMFDSVRGKKGAEAQNVEMV